MIILEGGFMNTEKIGNYIQKKRKECNFTQEELANKVYVTNKAVSRWENGKSLPEIETLYLLSKALNVSVNEILESGMEKEEKIQEYYKQERIKSKSTLLDIVIFGSILILMIATIYQVMELTLGISYENVNGATFSTLKEAFRNAHDEMLRYIFMHIIPWFILFINFIAYKLRNKGILYFTLFLNIVILMFSILFPSIMISGSIFTGLIFNLLLLILLCKNKNM